MAFLSSSTRSITLLLSFFLFSPFRFVLASKSVCRHEFEVFTDSLCSRCPLEISPNTSLQVKGEFLDRILTSKHTPGYTSVLFYASWCPFSRSMLPVYEKLSLMFPQIEFVAIERSSAMPSIFSRYGIHGLPSLLLVNQTSRVRYRGPKNLVALAQFYEKSTGLEAIQYYAEDQLVGGKIVEKSVIESWKGASLMEMVTREPYMAYAVLFLCLRVVASILPEVLFRLKGFFVWCVHCLNLGIFGGASQFMVQVLHMIDVRRAWNKLRLCKTQNFHARVWASSLASVSLGESSSSARLS